MTRRPRRLPLPLSFLLPSAPPPPSPLPPLPPPLSFSLSDSVHPILRRRFLFLHRRLPVFIWLPFLFRSSFILSFVFLHSLFLSLFVSLPPTFCSHSSLPPFRPSFLSFLSFFLAHLPPFSSSSVFPSFTPFLPLSISSFLTSFLLTPSPPPSLPLPSPLPPPPLAPQRVGGEKGENRGGGGQGNLLLSQKVSSFAVSRCIVDIALCNLCVRSRSLQRPLLSRCHSWGGRCCCCWRGCRGGGAAVAVVGIRAWDCLVAVVVGREGGGGGAGFFYYCCGCCFER